MIFLQLRVRGGLYAFKSVWFDAVGGNRRDDFNRVSAWFCRPQLRTILCIVAEGNLLPAENYRVIEI